MPEKLTKLILKPGREKSLLKKHPWVFSGAVARVEGKAAPGATVEVCSSRGEFLAHAAFSPQSQIRARVWTFEQRPVDEAFFRERIAAAITFRKNLGIESGETDSFRLVYSEADGLPGFIADRYADTIVLQALTAGAEAHKRIAARLLKELAGCRRVWERSDAAARRLEGLEESAGLLDGDKTDGPATIRENGAAFRVDVAGGHKTGFYLDQRENRCVVRGLAAGRRVLDCFCYTGGFGISAVLGGAESVVFVDSSAPALEAVAENAALNSVDAGRFRKEESDVFEFLRKQVAAGEKYGMIILDPPKFAAAQSQVESASRAYKDINMFAMKLLAPGGLLATFSCSGAVAVEDFRRIAGWAAADAGVPVSAIAPLSQAPCHPVPLAFPQAEYLKGLLLARM